MRGSRKSPIRRLARSNPPETVNLSQVASPTALPACLQTPLPAPWPLCPCNLAAKRRSDRSDASTSVMSIAGPGNATDRADAWHLGSNASSSGHQPTPFARPVIRPVRPPDTPARIRPSGRGRSGSEWGRPERCLSISRRQRHHACTPTPRRNHSLTINCTHPHGNLDNPTPPW